MDDIAKQDDFEIAEAPPAGANPSRWANVDTRIQKLLVRCHNINRRVPGLGITAAEEAMTAAENVATRYENLATEQEVISGADI